MKPLHWLLLAVGAYWLYSRSNPTAAGRITGTAGGGLFNPFGSRATGSGGTTASGPGMGTSTNNPPIGGTGSGTPTWPTYPTGTTPGVDSGDPCDVNSTAYDPDICASLYAQPVVDTMDPCDPSSAAYDPTQCGTPVDTASGDLGLVYDPTTGSFL